ncbi:MAG: DNA primase [Epsilonproteobacteria bacterium]|nr:MAG: DNA primase [Campylobacterota bacterium]
MITKNSIENLKTHLDVVDIISQYLELKKSGANFKACCPFHGEETASFVVSPAKQIYHCFGCGVGGDSINFVMEYEKLSYPETLEKLASMVNVSLEYDGNFKQQDLSILHKVNGYYEKLLTHNETASKYLSSRGISSSSIEKFEIGYAPQSNDTINYLKQNFLNLSDAQDFGIIDTGKNGLYARFIDRITFPIYALNSKIVGYGGRTISGHNAKYINSPQTKIFNKSRLLYGYNLAKELIYKKKEIIVTEGYLDVIMLHQAGFTNAVATLGTALTQDHLPLLKRGEPKVIVAYDGDKAGLTAAYKASLLLSSSNSNFEGGVVIFKDGQDPADMVQNKKIEELNNMFLNPQPFIPYVIDFIIAKYNLSVPMEKQNALQETNDYLKTLSPIFQSEYSKNIASKLNINQNLVNVQHNTHRKKQIHLSQVDIPELEIIKTVIENPSLLDMVLNTVDISMFDIHTEEFNMLLNDKENPQLRGLSVNEDIKVYDEEQLKLKLIMILVTFYTKKLEHIKYSDDPLKMKKIRKIQENIMQLRQGKLVPFSLD